MGAVLNSDIIRVDRIDIDLNRTSHYVFTLLITLKLPYISHGHSPLNLYRPIIVEVDVM